MIITKKIEETKIVDVVDDIICNKCGESCNLVEKEPDFGKEYYGLIEQVVSGGWFWRDCSSLTFSLCTNCIDKLFSDFKIPVKVDYW
jgi:hypothetical protein